MIFQTALVQPRKMLKNLASWLAKAEEHAKARGFDADCYVESKLAVDMYPLVKQVRAACDNAKFTAARLSGKQPPVHADTERTFAELQARVAAVLVYLDTFTEADFEGATERLVTLPFLPGKAARATDYLVEMALPNFMFHVVCCYNILRSAGVPLGKLDYIGGLTLQDA